MKNKGFYPAPITPHQVDTVAAATSAALVSATATLPFYAHFFPTEACYIVFGASNVDAPSSVNGILLQPNTDKMLEITKNTKYFRVIRATNDGVLRWNVNGETN